MYIKKIKLHNFRNYEEEEIYFDKSINVFYGDNAQGKTNIIEAIFLCGFAKSFRTLKEKELINLEKKEAFVEIEYEKSDRNGIIRVEINEKKEFFINNIKVKKLSEILGKINIVMFNPESIEIVKDGPNKRRRFLDMLIGQIKPKYVFYSSQYLKVLEQRNIYLRQIKYEKKPQEILSIWDEKLDEYAKNIQEERKKFIEKIQKRINIIHKGVTEEKEDIFIKYKSNYDDKYLENLTKNRKTDIQKGYTEIGIHRDDFEITINGKVVNIYGSQGQQRSSSISLKLAELEVIYEEIGEYPILLLDDFMSELDEKRRKNFLKNIKDKQVIITCTDKINNIISKNSYVKNGKIISERK